MLSDFWQNAEPGPNGSALSILLNHLSQDGLQIPDKPVRSFRTYFKFRLDVHDVVLQRQQSCCTLTRQIQPS